jgi:hypothetical protein
MYAQVAREILRFIRRCAASPASDKEFNALAREVFAFQFENNKLYRRFCRLEGMTPVLLKDWKDIPAMPALAFKELVLTSFLPRKKVRVFRSSGTTSASFRSAHYFKSLEVYEASIVPPFQKNVADNSFAYYFLMGRGKETPESSLSHMMETVNRRFAKGRGRFYVRGGEPDFGLLARDLKNERKKTVLLATAFALRAFLDHLKMNDIRIHLPAGSRLMETGGFKGRFREISKQTLYALCGRFLGLPKSACVSEYGMTELSSQFYARGGGVFAGPAWLRAQVMDPVTGKAAKKGRSGLLKIVDLANIGSVMAVQTEDLGRMEGRGFELIGRAAGSEARGCSLSYERFLKGSG